MIKQIEVVLMREEPRCVLLYGDTNSTLAGAVAASKLHIPIAHVEAGLRSFNTQMPEEINRIVTDRLSQLLFCPTHQALQNLENEGLKLWPANAYIVGDVMQEGAWLYGERAVRPENFAIDNDFVLCTVHRAENADDRDSLTEIFSALRTIAKEHQVIMPLHPRTAIRVKDYGISLDRISILPPVGYLTMIWLIKNSRLVITDSGGLQKEAFFFSKCCITLRLETEWVESVSAGVNALAGSSAAQILALFHEFKAADDFEFDQGLYGGGNTADKIVSSITGRYG